MNIGKIVKWIIGIIVIGLVAIVAVVAAVLFIFPQSLTGPTLPPLQLPALNSATTNTSAAPPDGTWTVQSGSVAGFRVEESFLVQSGTIVGRTSAVSGSLVMSHNQVNSGSFQADLSKLTMGGKPNDSFFKLLDTTQYPTATLTLTNPIVFDSIPSNNQILSSNAAGSLTMHGITHPVTFTFSGRYDGTVLEAIGSAPVLASDWNIDSPFGIHDNDVIEFLVILQRV